MVDAWGMSREDYRQDLIDSIQEIVDSGNLAEVLADQEPNYDVGGHQIASVGPTFTEPETNTLSYDAGYDFDDDDDDDDVVFDYGAPRLTREIWEDIPIPDLGSKILGEKLNPFETIDFPSIEPEISVSEGFSAPVVTEATSLPGYTGQEAQSVLGTDLAEQGYRFTAETIPLTGDIAMPVPLGPGVAVSLARLTGAGFTATQATRILRALPSGPGRAVMTPALWNRLPSWVKASLGVLGIGLGSSFVVEGAEIAGEIVGITGGGGELALGDVVQPGQIVRSWTANGVPMVRLSDGRMGARKKTGQWKFWRPKRPIVLYAGGASDAKTFLKADKALNRQAKRLRSALDRRAPKPRRRSGGTPHSHGTPSISNIEVS